MAQYILSTERLTLREMVLNDTTHLLKIFSDPIAMQYYPKTLTRQEAQTWINRVLENYGKYGFDLWACELKTTGEFVGQCGLINQNIDGREEIEVGYLFVRQFWRQGLASEAAKGCMQYAKEKLNQHRVISLIRSANTPSIGVAKKNGLTAEKQVIYKGAPHIVYAASL